MDQALNTIMQAEWTLGRLTEAVGGTVMGDSQTRILALAGVQEAEDGDLVFAENARFLAAALRSRAAAVITSSAALGAEVPSKPLLLVEDPRLAFVQALSAFAPPLSFPPGSHASASIGTNVRLGEGVHIAANVVVGDNVFVGDHVVLLSGVHVGHGVEIGDATVIHPNAVLYPRVRVGKRCILHAGCVIGADGFGYIPVGYALKKVPHLGTVEIEDDVEIGANTCVDRAKTGATVIGSGTKLDNLVHVAHNVRIGRSCLLIAQSGVAGSVTLGNGVVLAGQAGIKDHVSLGDGARVGAQGGVIGDVAAGVTVSGYPARPHAEKMRELAASASLPDYVKRIRALEKRIAEMEARYAAREEAPSSGASAQP